MAMALHAQLVRVAWRWAGHREDAEDLVSEAVLQLLRRPPRAQTEAQLRRWLLVVVRTRLVDLRRRPRELSIEVLRGV